MSRRTRAFPLTRFAHGCSSGPRRANISGISQKASKSVAQTALASSRQQEGAAACRSRRLPKKTVSCPSETTLRASEVCDLQWQQIELSEGRLHVHRVKNGIASLHPIRGDEMRALRKLRRDYPKDAHVFVSERGGPLRPIGRSDHEVTRELLCLRQGLQTKISKRKIPPTGGSSAP
jgi:integrase-like protein